AQFARQLTLSTNLANIDTPGYKQDESTIRDFQQLLLLRIGDGEASPVGVLSTAVRWDRPQIDTRQGALVETGRPFDLAIAGNAFFAVQTPDGVEYTRDGRFQLDAQRRVVTADGYPVLGEGGPLVVPPGDVWVEPDGTVLVGERVVGRLLLIEFPPDATFERVAGNRLRTEATGIPSATAGVSQGFIEASNVDLTKTVTDMLAATRSYQLAARSLQLADETLRLAVNSVGRVTQS
ncbi:MAG: flagellar hook-basal body protein, partial [Thermomicrobium sp.]|nr:flagellar hook-basal body protein [Thermomicrobium sp.]